MTTYTVRINIDKKPVLTTYVIAQSKAQAQQIIAKAITIDILEEVQQ